MRTAREGFEKGRDAADDPASKLPCHSQRPGSCRGILANRPQGTLGAGEEGETVGNSTLTPTLPAPRLFSQPTVREINNICSEFAGTITLKSYQKDNLVLNIDAAIFAAKGLHWEGTAFLKRSQQKREKHRSACGAKGPTPSLGGGCAHPDAHRPLTHISFNAY